MVAAKVAVNANVDPKADLNVDPTENKPARVLEENPIFSETY
jgi:hypothetical protein